MKRYIFVIDTDSYAGNFERDMCAYVTGVIGECGVGEEFSEIYRKELKEDESRFSDLLEFRSDDHGCQRPCSIWETAGILSDGKMGWVKEEDFDEKIVNANYRLTTAKYYQDQLNRVKNNTNWKKEEIEKEISRLEKQIEWNLSEKNVCGKCKVNNSVAIFFNEKPSKKNIELMKKRAYNFEEVKKNIGLSWSKNFKLTIFGFRLIVENTKFSSQDV